ncbi:hypothetical protein LTR10_013356 [Elasticomyces elasticus]|uniref:Major facilitator superfamily (MFS) profile domain-containing protein n=1 Tax=Exophiala sideris TaxID=1016849 RepID=A0ABR0J4M5_9EURO|nr:hypothetical protein LTR10_013356 [Elasticomyces elasticus]KAK5027415.1 hypothetical protein LTS07_007017 [Exophiala sideris]KAK5034883.1 hypothetical protein LTR13_006065 [Exophiala sideris]KAK5056383.1 hypothetical protein LTR69_007924 [Exophiala sideris]KAK5181128.1 hypothetical protein LTR44_006459 [Eurotiomycetes sp. CCFEE 6388]
MAAETSLSAKDMAGKAEHQDRLSEFERGADTPDPQQLKRIKMNVDLRICLVLGVLYTASVIDRVNLSPPMTAIAKKLRPGRFLGSIVVAWGLIIVGHGLVKNWHAMLALRCLLGILGGRLFLELRLSKMDGVGGRAGWRWIFLMEGIITIAFGQVAYLLIVDFPEDAHKSFKFLKDDEIKIVIDRINRDRLDVESPPFKLGPYLANARDWKIWFFAANFGLTSLVTYAAAYFLPLVLREGLGFSEAAAQCLSTPCYVFGAILGLSESVLSDRIGLRAPFLLLNCVIEIIGVVVLGYAKPSGARYCGAFLIIGGAQSNIPLSLTYQANNIRGVWKRAFCSATIVGVGGIGGIVGSLTIRSQDAPGYR